MCDKMASSAYILKIVEKDPWPFSRLEMRAKEMFNRHQFNMFNRHKTSQCRNTFQINTYSMKQPDLYYFETIKMTSQAWPNFVWRIRAAGELCRAGYKPSKL